jgi:hypothetical protein
LLKHHVRPRRLEIGTLALLGGLNSFLAQTASTPALSMTVGLNEAELTLQFGRPAK